MVYITGDKHTNFKAMQRQIQYLDIKKEDTFIILGDAGLNYSVNRTEDKNVDYIYEDTIHSLIDKNKLAKIFMVSFGFIPNILIIQGNHEAPAWLVKDYEKKLWNEGVVYVQPEFSKIMFAYEGEVFNIDGHTYMTIGGAYSVDKYYRLKVGANWFPEEQLSGKEKDKVLNRIKEVGQVDVVLSHTVPKQFIPYDLFLQNIDQSMVDNSMEEFLSSVAERLKYKKWYAGHYHAERKITIVNEPKSANQEFYILYENILCPFKEQKIERV